MRLGELTGRRVALLGLGIDVRAALDPILGNGPAEVVVVDSSLGSAGSVEVGGATLPVVDLASACARAEVLVRSPGFPRYSPELVAAREAGVAMTTPVDLYLAGLPAEVRTVLVTGTKGKSTTTDLIGRFARAAGLAVGVAGNLGIPVFQPGWDDGASVVVLEVSSYQASDLHHAATVAVVTSIAEDHLSWHGGLDRYLRDKLRVVSNDAGTAGTVLVPRAELRAREVLAELCPQVEPRLIDDVDLGPEVPLHRARNAALAAAVVAELGGEPPTLAQLAEAASSGMVGRLDVVASPVGHEHLTFVDDALASNPSATAAALSWALGGQHELVVILGGDDRGVSSAPLAAAVQQWGGKPDHRVRAVTLPHNGSALAAACGLPVLAEVDTVAEAVAVVVDALGGSDAMVLFSPAAPTPAGRGNWETRSKEFREAVRRLSHP